MDFCTQHSKKQTARLKVYEIGYTHQRPMKLKLGVAKGPENHQRRLVDAQKNGYVGGHEENRALLQLARATRRVSFKGHVGRALHAYGDAAHWQGVDFVSHASLHLKLKPK